MAMNWHMLGLIRKSKMSAPKEYTSTMTESATTGLSWEQRYALRGEELKKLEQENHRLERNAESMSLEITSLKFLVRKCRDQAKLPYEEGVCGYEFQDVLGLIEKAMSDYNENLWAWRSRAFDPGYGYYIQQGIPLQ